MKRIALLLGVCCALGGPGLARAQEEAGNETAAVAAAPAAPRTLQEQVDELRAKLQELEAQLKASQESTDREFYTVKDSAGKLVTGEKLKLSGYIQAQVTSDQAADPGTDFRVRRARLKLEAPVTELASGTIEFDATRTVSLKEAFLDLGRATDVWRLRFGQSKVPFMYDILQSSSARLAPEQTAVAQFLFPDEYDQGLWVQFKNALGDRLPGATLDVGVQNGQGPNAAELNESKDIVARMRFVLGNTPPDKTTEANSVYLGYINGDYTNDKKVTTDKSAVGGGISYLLGPVWFRGEYLAGQHLGNDFTGWYGQLAYEFPTSPNTLFARYDVLDENTDVANNTYKDLTVGWQRFLDAKTRVILAHEFRDPEPGYSKFSKTDGDITTLRLQVKY